MATEGGKPTPRRNSEGPLSIIPHDFFIYSIIIFRKVILYDSTFEEKYYFYSSIGNTAQSAL